jgi:hypothetical protein
VKIAEKSLKIGQLLPILATFYEFESDFEKPSQAMTYFQIDIF